MVGKETVLAVDPGRGEDTFLTVWSRVPGAVQKNQRWGEGGTGKGESGEERNKGGTICAGQGNLLT